MGKKRHNWGQDCCHIIFNFEIYMRLNFNHVITMKKNTFFAYHGRSKHQKKNVKFYFYFLISYDAMLKYIMQKKCTSHHIKK